MEAIIFDLLAITWWVQGQLDMGRAREGADFRHLKGHYIHTLGLQDKGRVYD